MRTLFLDIDGVLNSKKFFREFGYYDAKNRDHLDKVATARLNVLIEKSKCHVVISSCWRHSKDDLVVALSAAGSTLTPVDHTPFGLSDRGDEIQAWMTKHDVKEEEIVIFDDDSDMGHLAWRLIQTDIEDGLLDEHIADALTMWGIFEKTF